MELRKRMKVLCPIENDKTKKTFWMRLGMAFENRDGSTNVYLDALPVNRRLQLRPYDEEDEQPRRVGAAAEPAADSVSF